MSIGHNLRSLRELKPWTIEDLAVASDVSVRTIIRIENGHGEPQLGTLAKLAAALNTDASTLLHGLEPPELDSLVETFACSVCGAQMEQRGFVDFEHGDVEYEMFACGASRGWKDRPCPKDPSFPQFEDYRLETVDHGDGTFLCIPHGLTSAARSVELRYGTGPTRVAAEAWVRRSYTEAKEGSAAAELAFPWDSMLA